MAHLAGGLGKPTWLLLTKIPEWRWGLESDQTFWYPSLRLFRQTEKGNWDDVIAQVKLELTEIYPSTITKSKSTNPKGAQTYQENNFIHEASHNNEVSIMSAKEKEARELILKGDLNQAKAIYEDMILAGSRRHIIYGNLAAIYGIHGNLKKATELLKEAIILNPNDSNCHKNLGTALKERGEIKGAVKSYNMALELAPNDAEINYFLSLALLLQGNYVDGWEKYEYRLKRKDNFSKPHAEPKCKVWPERTLASCKQLLVVSEQGIGDTLMFMRYILLLKKQGIDVTLCAPQKLHSLIESSEISSKPITPEQANSVKRGNWILFCRFHVN